MRYVLLLIAVSLLISTACQSIPEEVKSPVSDLPTTTATVNTTVPDPPPYVPKYSMERVLAIAKERSPDCQIQVGTVIKRNEGDMCWGYVYVAAQYEQGEPVFKASYEGDGKWLVTKACDINFVYSRVWYFYEDTGELEVKRY